MNIVKKILCKIAAVTTATAMSIPLQVHSEAFNHQLPQNAPYITGDVNFNRILDEQDISIIATSIIQKNLILCI